MARKTRNRRLRDKYAIVVDGQTEQWYFKSAKNYQKIDVDIHPELWEKHRDIFKIVEHLLRRGYTKVFWLIDIDEFINKNQTDKLREYFKKFRSRNDIEILVNSPCLEFWFLLHFQKTEQFFRKCKNVERLLKRKYLHDYDKSKRYFMDISPNIFERLKDKLAIAIKNAQQLGEFDPYEMEQAKAEIYKILNQLLDFNKL